MDNRCHLGSLEMGHAAEEGKIFLDGVLQEEHVAPFEAQAATDDTGQVEKEGDHLVAVEAAREPQVDGTQVGQRVFVVGLRLIAGIGQSPVVAGQEADSVHGKEGKERVRILGAAHARFLR